MAKISVRKVRFQNESGVELTTSALRLVVVTSRGPRIAHFSRAGAENLLLWKTGKYQRGKWDLCGGHRVWLTRPGADENEETYSPDNAACAVEFVRHGFTVTTPVDPLNRMVRGLTVRALAADRLELTHFAYNSSDMLWSGGLWGLTCTLPTPTTTYVCPLSDGSEWDSANVVFFKRWGGGHTGAYNDPQFWFSDEALLARSLGAENKRMMRTAAGILAMHDTGRDVLFAKHVAFSPQAQYPLGCNLAFYTGPGSFMVEMETQSPFVNLRPAESFTHTETWAISAAGKKVPGAKQLEKLF